MNIPLVVAYKQTTLSRKIAAGAASFILESVLDKAGNTIAGLIGVTIDEGTSIEETFIGTLSGSTCTVLYGGLDPQNPNTAVAALQYPHDRGAKVKFTNYPHLAIIKKILNGETGFPNEIKYDAAPVLADALAIPYKSWVQSLSLAAGGITSFYVATVSGLNVSIGAGIWARGEDMVTYAGTASQAMTNNATNYIMLKWDGTIVINTSGFVDGHMKIYEVVASGGAITGLTDRRPWLTLAMVKRTVSLDFTYGATLAVGDPVRVDATATNKLIKALGTLAANADGFMGVALDAGADTDTNKRVQIGGLVTGLSGLTSNAPVYLTDAGGFSGTPGTYRKVVGWAVSTTAMILLRSARAEDIAGISSAGTTANLNELMALISTTDITGAELETLSSGGNADSLHTHDIGLQEATSINVEIPILGDSNVTSDLNGGSESFGPPVSSISSNVAGGAVHYLAVGNFNSDWDDDHILQGLFKPDSTVTRDDFFGMGGCVIGGDEFEIQENSALVIRHIGFLFEDGTVYASVANGTTQTKSAALAGFTYNASTFNKYTIVYDAGVSAKFYVNGVLKATLTTNLPSGATDYMPFRVGTEGDVGTKTVYYGGVKITIPAPTA